MSCKQAEMPLSVPWDPSNQVRPSALCGQPSDLLGTPNPPFLEEAQRGQDSLPQDWPGEPRAFLCPPAWHHALEKEMATHSSVLAWRIPGTGEPGGLSSMGLHRVGHD